MHYVHLTLLFCVFNLSSLAPASEHLPLSPTRISRSMMANPAPTNDVEPATNILLQSNDGGQTWQDISDGLPENEPEDFFAEESGLYLRVGDIVYRSKNNLKTPVWEKENGKSWEQVQTG